MIEEAKLPQLLEHMILNLRMIYARSPLAPATARCRYHQTAAGRLRREGRSRTGNRCSIPRLLRGLSQ